MPCNVAAVSASKLARDDCLETMSFFDQIRLEGRGKGNKACSAAGRVKNEISVKLERGTVGVNFEFFGTSELKKLADGTYELDGGRAEKLSEGI